MPNWSRLAENYGPAEPPEGALRPGDRIPDTSIFSTPSPETLATLERLRADMARQVAAAAREVSEAAAAGDKGRA